MKNRQDKAGTPHPRRRVRPPSAGGAYADVLTAEEISRFAEQASPVDELLLLRAQVHRLARRIDLDDPDSGFKQLRLLAEMIRAIAALERLRLQAGGPQGPSAAALAQAVAALDPRRQL